MTKLSYTEELTSECYKHREKNGKREFFVEERVPFQGEKSGWRDIDILAIGNTEIHIVSTKSYGVYKRNTELSIADTVEFFADAENFVRQTYDVDSKIIKKVFVADAISNNMINRMKNEGIDEVRRLEDVAIEFFQLLKNQHQEMPAKVGKEENNITRILLFLMYRKLVRQKSTCKKNYY